MKKLLKLTFKNQKTALALQINESVDLSTVLDQMELQCTHPVIVVVGGASLMSDESLARLRLLFVEVIAPLAQQLGAFVVDGGTDAGVMRMMGQARAEIGGTFPLIGIAPVDKIALPGCPHSPVADTLLEPNHTHFVLIPGDSWGDESPWLSRVATALAKGAPSVTILVNGGEIALLDVSENVKAGRQVVVLAGSGRLADEITRAVRYPEQKARECISQLLQKGHLTLFDLSERLTHLSKILNQKLTGRGCDDART
ncbi:MAG: hypothetical protein F6K36_10395 [Symploca sp. SIO3C6]|uniref:LSDAT prokaryote domain-containing protein n=1 Tax=Symploca sp. SIO1C4 TaxID=2607765 RepID=A0A6B3NAU5_9CYAN|nr:hypothetical protein [Symploca sp. SIO3C6]NER28035.1 hypothetical protein [Symploca sp. SIO1C4]NET04931.1 hypothetical protein [Symploca sp. SIO2B6]NET49506.1 hypothetical protein [Merismopedia sp. SIO2A8]